jgi:hypothetical protein
VADVPAESAAPAVTAPVIAEERESPDFRFDREEVRVRARKSAPISEAEVEDAEEVEVPVSRPARSSSRREEAVSTRPLRRSEPTDADEEDEEEARPRPRRFKRRRPPRRRRERSSSEPGRAWGWVRWVAAAVVYVLVGAGISIHMIATGHLEEWIMDAIKWVIIMPVSLVVFFISMFVGSAIAGGIDFGDIRTAIPKAIFLLAPINLCLVLFSFYIGSFMSLPFWIFGLILLFDLDVWESWFMIVINWFLNSGLVFLLGFIIVAMMHGAWIEKDKDSLEKFDEPVGAAIEMQRPPPKGNR